MSAFYSHARERGALLLCATHETGWVSALERAVSCACDLACCWSLGRQGGVYVIAPVAGLPRCLAPRLWPSRPRRVPPMTERRAR